VVHPQSIIHSMVQFVDGSIKAQMGLPSMALPIAHALTYPDRAANQWPRFNFMEHPSLTFQQPDLETFACLRLAFQALAQGGSSPCVLNAANEVAVAAFLAGKIAFLQIANVVDNCLQQVKTEPATGLEALQQTDASTRRLAEKQIQHILRSVS